MGARATHVGCGVAGVEHPVLGAVGARRAHAADEVELAFQRDQRAAAPGLGQAGHGREAPGHRVEAPHPGGGELLRGPRRLHRVAAREVDVRADDGHADVAHADGQVRAPRPGVGGRVVDVDTDRRREGVDVPAHHVDPAVDGGGSALGPDHGGVGPGLPGRQGELAHREARGGGRGRRRSDAGRCRGRGRAGRDRRRRGGRARRLGRRRGRALVGPHPGVAQEPARETSSTRWPPAWSIRLSSPSALAGATTRLAMVWPGRDTFRLEVDPAPDPSGRTAT